MNGPHSLTGLTQSSLVSQQTRKRYFFGPFLAGDLIEECRIRITNQATDDSDTGSTLYLTVQIAVSNEQPKDTNGAFDAIAKKIQSSVDLPMRPVLAQSGIGVVHYGDWSLPLLHVPDQTERWLTVDVQQNSNTTAAFRCAVSLKVCRDPLNWELDE